MLTLGYKRKIKEFANIETSKIRIILHAKLADCLVLIVFWRLY